MKPATPGVPTGLKLTYDDFVLFPDDGKRHELIDGEHYVTPSPNTRHQQIQGDVFRRIWNYLEAHPIGRIFTARLDVVFSKCDVVVPGVTSRVAFVAESLTWQHRRPPPVSP